ncbi:hypothetical protein L218DRAFT_827353, partial [Marasmius fiardii PR-910]
DATPTARLKEGIRLMFSSRGIGWSHEPKHALPPSPNASVTRTQFVLQQLFLALLQLGGTLLIAFTYVQKQPCFKIGGPSAGDPVYGVTRRALNVLAFGVSAVLGLSMFCGVVNAIWVALGMTTPQECPSFFGSPLHSFTLRGFWGKSWHQLLRPVCSLFPPRTGKIINDPVHQAVSPYGRFLAGDVLGFKRGSVPYGLIQCYTAFFITGLLHEISDTMTRQDRTIRLGSSLIFFVLQPVGITIESVIVYLYQSRFGGERGAVWEKMIGFLWVASWLVWCGPIFID